MRMDRLLNIGAPYVGMRGGDKQRAWFQREALGRRYHVDELWTGTRTDLDAALAQHTSDENVETLEGYPGKSFRPNSILEFSPEACARFEALLRENRYDVIFIRYLGPSRLAAVASRVLPEAKIVVDADMLVSRIAKQAWKLHRSLANRYFLFESIRVGRYESHLFKRPFLFLMSNTEERAYVCNSVRRPDSPGSVVLAPNPMPEIVAEPQRRATGDGEKYVLFHGILGSSVNCDAYQFLVEQIYPRLHPYLEKHDVYVHVVGRGAAQFHRDLLQRNPCDRLKLVGEIDDLGGAIQGAELCLVPLRMGSGTKTRILEIAAHGNAVVSTPMGVEGMNFDDSQVVVRESAADLADAVGELLADPDRCYTLAVNLQAQSHELFAREHLAERLLSALE